MSQAQPKRRTMSLRLKNGMKWPTGLNSAKKRLKKLRRYGTENSTKNTSPKTMTIWMIKMRTATTKILKATWTAERRPKNVLSKCLPTLQTDVVTIFLTSRAHLLSKSLSQTKILRRLQLKLKPSVSKMTALSNRERTTRTSTGETLSNTALKTSSLSKKKMKKKSTLWVLSPCIPSRIYLTIRHFPPFKKKKAKSPQRSCRAKATRAKASQMSPMKPPKRLKRQRKSLIWVKRQLKSLTSLKSEVDTKALAVLRPMPLWNVSLQNKDTPHNNDGSNTV